MQNLVTRPDRRSRTALGTAAAMAVVVLVWYRFVEAGHVYASTGDSYPGAVTAVAEPLGYFLTTLSLIHICGVFDSPEPGAELTDLLSSSDRYGWSAAVVGSSNAAGYQLASGQPVMAVGGFNGTDPAPTLDEFQDLVAAKQIHYFIGGRSAFGGFGGNRSGTGSHEASDIADWVKATYPPISVDDAKLYDLTAQPLHS